METSVVLQNKEGNIKGSLEEDRQVDRREKMAKRGEERPVGKTSHFSLTCRLLSQYLKKNGNCGGELALRQQDKENSLVPNTVSFEPGVDVSGKNRQHHAENSILTKEESNMATNTKEKWKDQFTVFYGGKVVVFDNIPADTAKDLMLMASKDTTADPTATCNLMTLQQSQPKSTQANNSADMPIARRNSLHRFLEKRKDRMGKAPYQVHGGSEVAKTEEDQPWLSLGRQVPGAGSTSHV